MQAVVLAAGEGTRLRPLTEDKPKGMVEVDEEPILTHCFDQLVDLGADELIVVGYPEDRDEAEQRLQEAMLPVTAD